MSHDTCENLAKEIEDKVYEIEISQEDLIHFQNTYRVSNLYRNGDRIILRTVTDSLPESYKSTKASPTLEDLYLYVFEEGI